MGRESVRKVPSDKQGKISSKALKQMILEDIEQGNIPYLINLTAGTTVLGAYDPIQEVVDMIEQNFANKPKIWIHVDASR